MCGILGVLDPVGRTRIQQLDLEAMTAAMASRGPDDSGSWVDDDVGVAMAHRRLSIIDLSSGGHQPMISPSGRYVIVLNGEIYNFRELRRMLESRGHHFRGHSDTEVVLTAFESYGIVPALSRFIGMFALAVWDRKEQSLHLSRDRIGKKPLYYGYVNGALVYGSVLKVIVQFPGFSGDIDRDALALYLRHNYIPAPHSIYKGMHKLRPGHFIRFDIGNGQVVRHKEESYWSAENIWRTGTSAAGRFTGSQDEADAVLEDVLSDAVRIRMISDVPLGAFLSGGIDSSLIVALMQEQSQRPVRTFTVGFAEGAYNEAGYAREVAQHLGTEHTEVFLSPNDALDVIPSLPEIYDEPFSDSSQIPTYLVSKVAREHVTVALSGDGGDELFCGYNRYLWWRQIWSKLSILPPSVRRISAKILTGVPVTAWDRVLKLLAPVLPNELRHGVPGQKIHKAAALFATDDPTQLYLHLISHWKKPEEIVIGSVEPETIISLQDKFIDVEEFTERMMMLDICTYLPDDILVKVDRASMAVSLEARNPLLDHRVVEFAASLPLSSKLSGSVGKLPLRRMLSRRVPDAMFDRPKTGFGVPIDEWLRGPLRDWAEALIAPDRLAREGYFEVEAVRSAWDRYLQRRDANHYLLWDILMFQAWHEYSKGVGQSMPGSVAA